MIKRDTFLYMDPRPPLDQFGQCESCTLWTGWGRETCLIHGSELEVKAGDSCALYAHGSPRPEMTGSEIESVTPKESGFVSRQVRCENCKAFEPAGEECKLFRTLSKEMPEMFSLGSRVHPQGCCNAQQPRSLVTKR